MEYYTLLPSPVVPCKYPLISVDAPRELDFNDHVETFGIEMSLIHNVFIRGLNSMHYYAPIVSVKDIPAFVGYTLVWIKLLKWHHDGEERIIFPFLHKKLDMSENVKQHAVFLQQLEAYEMYLKAVETNTELYSSGKVRELVEAFADNLVEHLHEEISTLSPEQLVKCNKEGLDAMIDEHTKHIQGGALSSVFVFVATHHDSKAFPMWPPMPRFVMWIVKYLAYWVNRRFWKFSSYNNWNGEPQTYAAPRL